MSCYCLAGIPVSQNQKSSTGSPQRSSWGAGMCWIMPCRPCTSWETWVPGKGVSLIPHEKYRENLLIHQDLFIRLHFTLSLGFIYFCLFFSPRLGHKESECLLVTIKTDGCGTVIVKPDFNKGKEPYRQVHGISGDVYIISTHFNTGFRELELHFCICSWNWTESKDLHVRMMNKMKSWADVCDVQDCHRRGEERSLASYCGERFCVYESRGQGQGAEHVQRCEFIFVTIFSW